MPQRRWHHHTGLGTRAPKGRQGCSFLSSQLQPQGHLRGIRPSAWSTPLEPPCLTDLRLTRPPRPPYSDCGSARSTRWLSKAGQQEATRGGTYTKQKDKKRTALPRQVQGGALRQLVKGQGRARLGQSKQEGMGHGGEQGAEQQAARALGLGAPG